jgi:hypothetical protein
MLFLSLSKPIKFSFNCFKTFGLLQTQNYSFTRKTKSTQLILFNNQEIEKIHLR